MHNGIRRNKVSSRISYDVEFQEQTLFFEVCEASAPKYKFL